MADSEMFSALLMRQRLEDIARTITEARVAGDVYGSLDTAEQALLAVLDEIDVLARAVADTQAMIRQGQATRTGWVGRLSRWRSASRA